MTKFGSVACAALFGALLLGAMSHAAQAQFFRGMNRDGANPLLPQVANTALGLGVRPQDVGNPAPGVLVQPNSPPPPVGGRPQGTSGAINNNPCSLPAFSRPAGVPWNGTGGANVRVFRINPVNLPATLQVQAAPTVANPDHAVISTVAPGLTLANMQAAVGGTQANWAIVAVPPGGGNCP